MKKEMRDLENKIRIKLKNDYTSVRKAFLNLDRDRDGFIEPTEIIRSYGNSIDIDYELLEAIFR
jgi:Ca2+-binding EF-hand superfamily protein